MAEMNPAKFVREVRSEIGKVTWPTRKETIVSTIFVLAIAAAAALFFFVVDWFFGWSIGQILGLAK